MIIYHIADQKAWEMAQKSNVYINDSLKTQGFIHSSTRDQLFRTADRRFVNENELSVLEIDTDKLDAEVKFEEASTGEKHPHIFGTIPRQAVIKVIEIKKDSNGNFSGDL